MEYTEEYIVKISKNGFNQECQEWFDKQGKRHRVGGPAVDHPNYQEYYKHGVPHRLDGPAFTYSTEQPSFFIEGKRYEKEEFDKEIIKIKEKFPLNDKIVEIDGVKYKLGNIDKNSYSIIYIEENLTT
jgi:hypothetical protein